MTYTPFRFGPTLHLHNQAMQFLWCPIIDILIIIATFSSSRLALYIHIIGGLMLSVFSLMITLPILATSGIVDSQSDPEAHNHMLIGLVCLLLIVVQIILGALSRIANMFPTNSVLVISINKAHKILGITLAVLAKMTVMFIIYEKDKRNVLLILQIPLITFYLYRKFLSSKLEEINQFHNTKSDEDSNIKKVSSLKDILKEGKLDLVIFQNYIYELEPMKEWHPAGYQIIQSVKNHQIDKFIYGMQGAYQFPMINPQSHSRLALNLLDSPIAKIEIKSCYQNVSNRIQVTIKNLKLITKKGDIYEMYLQSQSPLIFNRYTQIKQLGRYYSLTLNQSITRLYTNVNFLHFANVQFLSKHLHGQEVTKYFQDRLNYPTELPILFRHYKSGRMTDTLINKTIQKIQLSCEKGEGLQLDTILPGKILIVAGGTGIYPFSDLIDHLYKQKLLKENPLLQKQICELNPLLLQNHFGKFKFKFMVSFNYIEQIHPVTWQQLLFLAKDPQHSEIVLRIKQNWNYKNVNSLQIVNDKFQTLLEGDLSDVNLQKTIVCGPPRMNQQLYKLLKKRISFDKFMIM